MAKQSFSIGQVLEAADMTQLQANDYNWTVSTKTANYTLAAADKGTRIVMNSASPQTVTVDDAVFDAGDVVWIHNINTGTCTVTAGTATVNTAGSLALAQWEGGVLYFTSAASAIFFPAGGVGAANFSDAATGTYSSGGFNYKYITYTASGTLTTTKAGFADILIVAGGGGGGNVGGGGGAGGHLLITNAYLPVGTLTVTVGAGGAGALANGGYNAGQNGNASRLGSYYSPGGGAGSGQAAGLSGYSVGGNGGSGGGAGATGTATNGGAGVTDIGNAGGNNIGGSVFAGGGGGGAGAAGGNNSAGPTGGAGGAGTSSSLDNVATTRAGGGGGGSIGGTAGSGGSGGGGAGTNNNTTATSGTANTGGGGGGGGFASGNGAQGGAGGSGIVIVRVKT